MRPSTVRRVVAGGVVVALITLGAAAFLSGSGEPGAPQWKGDTLDTARGTGTEIAIEPVTLPNPELVAAAALGKPKPSFTSSTTSFVTTYTDGDVVVRVRALSPVRVSGQRTPAPGALPAPPEALTVADGFLRAFGLDPGDWTVKQSDGAGFRSVTYEPRADLPIFAASGVEAPRVAIAIDKAGVRSFSATLARLAPRPAALVSQQEAFARVDRAGRYESVRLVLVDRGTGVIRPHWEFNDADGKLYPVMAVLTA